MHRGIVSLVGTLIRRQAAASEGLRFESAAVTSIFGTSSAATAKLDSGTSSDTALFFLSVFAVDGNAAPRTAARHFLLCVVAADGTAAPAGSYVNSVFLFFVPFPDMNGISRHDGHTFYTFRNRKVTLSKLKLGCLDRLVSSPGSLGAVLAVYFGSELDRPTL